MKNFLIIKTIIISLSLGMITKSAFAQPSSDADPAITSMSFATSPVNVGQTTTLTITFINNGFNSSIATGSVGLQISLPTSREYIASPESVAAISGTFAGKFNFTYNVGTTSFIGISNQPIAPGAGGTIVVNVIGEISVLSRISTANIQRLNPFSYQNENTNNNNLTAALGVAAGGPLAVNLLTFTATKQSKVVDLNWQTATELNSNHFVVEFSRDGTVWQTLGQVAAAGTSSTTRNYSFVHNTPVNGVNYYRLNQVDNDANFKYSVVRTVKFSATGGIILMPNPTVDMVYLSSNEGGTIASVKIFSTTGKLMQQVNNYQIGKGIDLSKYAPAVYVIQTTDQDGTSNSYSVIKK